VEASMNAATDLVQRLTAAAVSAIESEAPALTSPVGHVRGITVELVIDGAGARLGW
jgi:hypothetical protein